jgi:4-amino-4-deoxy-L-arabinose transferase-like glycosyltransferase
MKPCETVSDTAEISARENIFGVPTPSQGAILLFLYFGLHLLSRTFISSTAELDESEQLILTQSFSWGFGPQPPLYAWIQGLAFWLFGVNIFALAIVKNVLLAATYVFTYLNARFITRDATCGLAAAFSLLFLPQIAWESQRDLTHSVLVSTLATATLFCFLRLIEAPKKRFYCLAGLCIGLGFLAKYNYAVFLLGLIFAALSIGQTRVVLLNRRVLFTLAIATAVILPHVLWAFQHWELVFATAQKFDWGAKEGTLRSFLRWLSDILVTSVLFAAPLMLVYIPFFRKSFFSKTPRSLENLYEKLLIRKLVIIFAGLAVAGLFLGVTNVKDRWFQPILICLPVLLIARVKTSIELPQFGRLFGAALFVAATLVLIVPGHVLVVSKIARPMRLNAPFRELAGQIRTLQLSPDVLIAENRWIGGNLRLAFPEKLVFVPEIPMPTSFPDGRRLLVWDATASPLPPKVLTDFLGPDGRFDSDSIKPGYVEAPYQYGGQKQMRLGVLIL